MSVLPSAGGRALDLGCGAGRHAVLLAGRFAHVDAISLSLPMIEIARAKRSRPNVAYQQADLLAATGSGESDLVLSVMTLYHVPDLQAALAHIKGLLAPGGQIVLADPYPAASALHPSRRILHRLVPLRPRLHAMAVLRLGASLSRRGSPWFSPRSGGRGTHAMPFDTNCRRDLARDRTVQRGACADGCSEP